ncbi:protein ImuB [Shimia gijangensis]|uniref:Protein ImuB n=1 Tax=Shimia gijangensis TaxID=1470563 RepID=A0A1M6K7D4_9RHOB|nr:DNA polymerase Y family protein [Shimia gijangensis]SHJ54787.1 protein ImuB [Shimia gijangensis]
MVNRRVLSLWFPRLGAERLIRSEPDLWGRPFAVLRDTGQMQVVASVSQAASREGVHVDQPHRDAQAMCPGLLTRLQNRQAEAAFLGTLRRWAVQFSPWVAEEAPASLMLDITGCAHLFGGEQGVIETVQEGCERLGLTVLAGVADTAGAAWALARFSGRGDMLMHRSGDAIDQEAPATRVRAARRRHWTKGGAAPQIGVTGQPASTIAPVGQTRTALADIPVAGLRIDAETQAHLARLGLRKIADLANQPRATVARRFGKGLILRLDQALGSVPEPIAPAREVQNFAVRMTLPEPIGLRDDIEAGMVRLLDRLCVMLEERGKVARQVRLQAFRVDQGSEWIEVGLARASSVVDRIRPLLSMKLDEIDAGFGIDMLRLEAVQVEAALQRPMAGRFDAEQSVAKRLNGSEALDDLIGRVGARVGLERITRLHPADSHLPEKTAKVMAAAWAAPYGQDWPAPATPRPTLIWRPEPVTAPDSAYPPGQFRWRGRDLHLAMATGPERITPEWWLDDPEWRSGVRDYWRVTCREGDCLHMYYAHGGAMSAGWFCQGSFA